MFLLAGVQGTCAAVCETQRFPEQRLSTSRTKFSHTCSFAARKKKLSRFTRETQLDEFCANHVNSEHPRTPINEFVPRKPQPRVLRISRQSTSSRSSLTSAQDDPFASHLTSAPSTTQLRLVMRTLFWLTGPATAMQAASGVTSAPASCAVRARRPRAPRQTDRMSMDDRTNGIHKRS